MDAGDFWKLLVGSVVTLVGSALLHQLQLGTRRHRRRRRRDIGEQNGLEPCRRASVELRRIPAVQAAEL